jgi:ADP-ribose pyrophosphatase
VEFDREVIHRAAKFRCERWTERGGLRPRALDVVIHPGAAVILPWLDDRRIVMIRNERAAVGKTLLELPAGTLDPGEAPHDCARRELEEETGYRAAEMTPLVEFFSTPGFCTERMFVFEARRLRPGPLRLETDERVEPAIMEYDAALRAVENGEIADAKSMVALLYRARFRSGTGTAR